MTLEQKSRWEDYKKTLPALTVEQLFADLHDARLRKSAANDEDAVYWRAVMISVGEQLHRRLGPGALQEYGRRYG